jgi:hypothetical protein
MRAASRIPLVLGVVGVLFASAVAFREFGGAGQAAGPRRTSTSAAVTPLSAASPAVDQGITVQVPAGSNAPAPAGNFRASDVVSESDQVALQERAFAARREGLIKALREIIGQAPGSVDRLEFDAAGPIVRLEVTAPTATPVTLKDTAWAITSSVLGLWEPATLRLVPNAVPAFQLVLNGHRIDCPAGAMVELANEPGSREHWTVGCAGAG